MALQMNETEEALAQLAAQVPSRPKLAPDHYEFISIGEQIVASLIKAADEQVEEAHALRDQVMQLAENIGAQLQEHAKLLDAMRARTKEFGLAVLDAHKKFINGGKNENPSP
jgi:predicted metal-dependent hydrolase